MISSAVLLYSWLVISTATSTPGSGLARKATATTTSTASSSSSSSSAQRLVEAALASQQGTEWVRGFSDGVGARFAGSEAANLGVRWVEKKTRELGLSPVLEAVRVPRWIRGASAAEVVAPSKHTLSVLALGGSVATPENGLSAEVLVVSSFDELNQRSAEAKGKIVLFNVVMQRTRDFSGYGDLYAYRARGASAAAKHGAVACLIRSIGTGSHQLPHTGGMRYADDAPRIPVAAISHEDAELLARMRASFGAVSVRLLLTPHVEPEVDSSNVVVDIKGAEKASEIVLAGCHLDSWDIGRGALDDAAGCSMLLELARLIRREQLVPKRTIRLVFFMNEEFGLSGGFAYGKAHQGELQKHVLALEADAGAGRAIGLAVTGDAGSSQIVQRWMKPFEWLVPLSTRHVEETGADLIPLHQGQVPQVGISQDASEYFDWHHTAGDTFDKVKREDLAHATAAFIALAWAGANEPDLLPRTQPVPQ